MLLALGGPSDGVKAFLLLVVTPLVLATSAVILLRARDGGRKEPQDAPDARTGLGRIALLLAAVYAVAASGVLMGAFMVFLENSGGRARDIVRMVDLVPITAPALARLSLIVTSLGSAFLACAALTSRRPLTRGLTRRERTLVVLSGFVSVIVWPIVVAVLA